MHPTPRRPRPLPGQDGCPRTRPPAPAVAVLLLLAGLAATPLASQTSPHGELSVACEACHSTEAWTPLRDPLGFRHEELSRLALERGHAGVQCLECHSSLELARVASACADCHFDPHRGELGATCEQCHSPAGWENRRRMADAHATTLFPLTGAHAVLDCAACHDEEPPFEFRGAPTECFAWHAADYNATTDPDHREAGFSITCEQCHSTRSFEGAVGVDHDAFFPLTGAHRTLDCVACHADGFAGTPTDCFACHAADYDATTDPDHVAAGFSTTCEECHTTTTWEDADFDHDALYFPIDSGPHQGTWGACSDCHTVAGSFALFDCTACHEHERSEMDDEHDDVAGYVYESTACFACHPRGRE